MNAASAQFTVMLQKTLRCLPNTAKSSGPEVIKLFFVLNSVEHEISNAHKYKNIKIFGFFQAQISGEGYFSCS